MQFLYTPSTYAGSIFSANATNLIGFQKAQLKIASRNTVIFYAFKISKASA
jgi:hypothetical protein